LTKGVKANYSTGNSWCKSQNQNAKLAVFDSMAEFNTFGNQWNKIISNSEISYYTGCSDLTSRNFINI
jgi:hypothetical protein